MPLGMRETNTTGQCARKIGPSAGYQAGAQNDEVSFSKRIGHVPYLTLLSTTTSSESTLLFRCRLRAVRHRTAGGESLDAPRIDLTDRSAGMAQLRPMPCLEQLPIPRQIMLVGDAFESRVQAFENRRCSAGCNLQDQKQ